MKILAMRRMFSCSEKETKDIAKNLVTQLKGGEILALHGDLGAGKTTFVKGLAAALGIEETITSPTFVLMRVFRVPGKKFQVPSSKFHELVHIDAYRLSKESELEGIGALDYLGRKDVVTVIEWPERVGDLLKKFKKVIAIFFTHGGDSQERIIEIKKD